ncbi:hypothetical protein GCM10009642_01860 [Nocardiopsis metallicus]
MTRRSAVQLPDCRCVIVTSHGRPGYLKSALAAGARGFLPKTVSSRTFTEVVSSVAAAIAKLNVSNRHEAARGAAQGPWRRCGICLEVSSGSPLSGADLLGTQAVSTPWT